MDGQSFTFHFCTFSSLNAFKKVKKYLENVTKKRQFDIFLAKIDEIKKNIITFAKFKLTDSE